MQGNGQARLGHLRQAIEGRNDSRGAERYPALGNPVGEIVHHEIHRRDHVIEVEQRFPHAHHDHVGDHAPLAGLERIVGVDGQPHLADDLGGREVALKSLLSR